MLPWLKCWLTWVLNRRIFSSMTLVDKYTKVVTLTGLRHKASFLLSALVIITLLGLAGCDSGPEIIKISGTKMGTSYHITVVADQPAPADLAARIDAALDIVDQSMSTYKPQSEISRFNGLPGDSQQSISAEFAEVLAVSKMVWEQSGGALDPTVGPLVDLWGFGPVATDNRIPDDQELTKALAETGFQYVQVSDQVLSKTKPVGLDLSAVAKGYGVDQVAQLLEMLALPDYLVEVGGEMRVSGVNPDGNPWRVAVEMPSLMPQVQRVIALHDGAVATSGDYRNYFVKDGVRYSHTIDPRTGRPIVHSLASVTVLAETCAEADAWATALMVLGEEQGMALAEKLKLAVYMLVADGADYSAQSSSEFTRLVNTTEN
jgi:thiamine biosynthesis lipoprotein